MNGAWLGGTTRPCSSRSVESMKPSLLIVCCVVVAGALTGCSDGGGDEPAPVGGINGPARVDPDGGATVNGEPANDSTVNDSTGDD